MVKCQLEDTLGVLALNLQALFTTFLCLHLFQFFFKKGKEGKKNHEKPTAVQFAQIPTKIKKKAAELRNEYI